MKFTVIKTDKQGQVLLQLWFMIHYYSPTRLQECQKTFKKRNNVFLLEGDFIKTTRPSTSFLYMTPVLHVLEEFLNWMWYFWHYILNRKQWLLWKRFLTTDEWKNQEKIAQCFFVKNNFTKELQKFIFYGHKCN